MATSPSVARVSKEHHLSGVPEPHIKLFTDDIQVWANGRGEPELEPIACVHSKHASGTRTAPHHTTPHTTTPQEECHSPILSSLRSLKLAMPLITGRVSASSKRVMVWLRPLSKAQGTCKRMRS